MTFRLLAVGFDDTGLTLVWEVPGGRMWTGLWRWTSLPSWPMPFVVEG